MVMIGKLNEIGIPLDTPDGPMAYGKRAEDTNTGKNTEAISRIQQTAK